ncbi:hypothetical protein Tco_0498671 [Tanacetum coccineum]
MLQTFGAWFIPWDFVVSCGNAKVFQKILDICPRVQVVDFAEVPDNETTLTFLIDLGYKGPLYKHPSMYVDHMHQLWRTLAADINKRLSGKSASNDRLRKSRIDILWGMFYRENVDYPELIWEDLAFQIDHNVSLELGKSISLTESVEEEAARQVHVTHERIVTESDPELARRRPLGIAFRDTSDVSKKMSPDP